MKAKKILLQLPDGLKPHVFDYFSKLSEKFSVIISSEPFYGACDVGNMEVYKDVDCIVQLGHSEIPNINYPKPVIFEEYRNSREIEMKEGIFDLLKEKNYRTIGLVSSIQYVDMMYDVRNALEKTGFKAIIGRQDRRMKYPGQVLGCNFSAAHSISQEADCFLVVSTGKFHGIGVQLSTDKEVFILDLNEMRLVPMREDTDRFLKVRYARLSRAMDAKRFCVVADTKIGQYRKKLAEVIVDQVREAGKQAVLVTTNDIKPSDYENMMCDAVIFTGCPRVPIDDQDKFAMPILTPPEFQSLFGIKRPSRYVMDEIVAVDSQF
jgi:2-(3-amino-3-carboxypropyl)histidine synthase